MCRPLQSLYDLHYAPMLMLLFRNLDMKIMVHNADKEITLMPINMKLSSNQSQVFYLDISFQQEQQMVCFATLPL